MLFLEDKLLTSNKKVDKAKIIEKYKVGDIIKNAIVKGYSSFGCFFDVNNEIRCSSAFTRNLLL